MLPVLCGHLEARSLAFLQASMAEESRLCNLQVCLQAVEACVDRRDADAWHPHNTPHWSAVDDSVEYSIPHLGSFHRWYASGSAPAPASALPLYLPLALPLALPLPLHLLWPCPLLWLYLWLCPCLCPCPCLACTSSASNVLVGQRLAHGATLAGLDPTLTRVCSS